MFQCLDSNRTVRRVDGRSEPVNRAKWSVVPPGAYVEDADIVMLAFFDESVLLVAAKDLEPFAETDSELVKD